MLCHHHQHSPPCQLSHPPPIINSTISPGSNINCNPTHLSVPTKIEKNLKTWTLWRWRNFSQTLGSLWRKNLAAVTSGEANAASGPITDILVWIECYASMVSVLATRYPSKIPQLMSHQKTIVKAHRTFTGEGCVTYDVCFRRKEAITKSLDWGEIDFTLNEIFTGRAKLISRCQHCSSDMHKSQECAYAPTTPSLSQYLA